MIISAIKTDKNMSALVAVKILPTSMLSTDILNPLLFLMMIKPMANEIADTKPIAASPLMVFDVDRYLINKEASITNGMATYKGCSINSIPKINPAKLTWAKPSAIIACWFKTKNGLNKAADSARAIPIIKAYWIKS